jgi:hypothetical protein
MGYYIRVLGKELSNIPLDQLREAAKPAILHISEGDGDAWEQLTLSHKSGQEIAILERNPVVEGQLGADELREFIDEVPHYKPETAAIWLQQYLPNVKVIYAFQLLSGTDVDDGWTPLHRLLKPYGSTLEAFSKPMARGFAMRTGLRFCGSLPTK